MLLVSTVIAAIAVLAGAILFVQVGDQTAREADAQLARHVAEQSRRIDDLYVQAQRDIRLARRNAVFEEVMSKPPAELTETDRAHIDAALTYIGERYDVDETCLILANGTELGRWDHGQTAGPDALSTEELINNPGVIPTLAQPDDTTYVSPEPYVSPDTARWVTAFLTPIVLDDGRHAGVLHFEIPIEAFSDELLGDPFSESSYSFIMDRDGRLLVHPDLARFREQSGLAVDPADSPFPFAASTGSDSWRAAIAAARGAPEGIVSFDDGGRSYRLEFDAIAGPSWIIGTVVPTTDLYAAVERARLNLVVTIGPLILLMVVISVWFAGRLSRTNQHLASANVALAGATQASSELAAIVQSAEDAIMSVRPDGRIATMNKAAERTFGVKGVEVDGRPLTDLFGADRRDEIKGHLETVARGEPVERYEMEVIDAEGGRVDLSLTYSPLPGGAESGAGASVIGRDISDLKRLEEELAHQALHDSLTGMPNRALFRDRLDHALRRAKRVPVSGPVGTRTAVLFIDLDDFKVINDTLGHRIGDALLVSVGGRITSAIRPGDTAARLGGDEFTVLLESLTDAGEARLVADRILAGLAAPFHLEGHDVTIGASIGIVLGDSGLGEPDDLLRSADTALYVAKGSGKGRHATFDPSMNKKAWQRLELETELRRAIQGNELVVHYQPIVELETGVVTEVEALVRWQHPERGLVGPNDFIPLAEQTGLIVSIGQQVIATACRDLASWRSARPEFATIGVSVNMSPRELLRGELVGDVIDALGVAGLRPDALRIEITEGVELEDPGAIERLTDLRKVGVRVSIDDFGTGYSSLGSFRRLPIDGLKIDRSFVAALGQEREETAIVSAAVSFAGALGIGATGEGIETPEQWQALRELGCRYGQGYLLGRPAPADSVASMSTTLPLPGRRKGPSASAA